MRNPSARHVRHIVVHLSCGIYRARLREGEQDDKEENRLR
jgi:hypothetical protein